MLLLRFCLLWGLVAVHILGGAILFRRLCPRESPWFGFIVPAMAVVLGFNLLEHAVGFPSLRGLLPFTFLGSLWLIIIPRTNWRLLRVPAFIFLLAFAFTLFLRFLKPDIAPIRDGMIDAHLMADYAMGQGLPPTSSWLPPFKLLYYYSFQHYAASVLIRLLGLDLGTGFNVSSALLSASIFFLIGATAWRVGRHKLWIVLVTLALTAATMVGSTPYLVLAERAYNDPNDTTNLLNRADAGLTDPFPFEQHLRRINDWWQAHELIPPGYWAWTGCFHSAVAGQFLTVFAVYCLVEMVRRRRTNLPWIGSLGACWLLVVCSTWGLPYAAVLFLAGLGWCWRHRIFPRDFRIVVIALGVLVLCLTPTMLYYLELDAPLPMATLEAQRTPLFEFAIQWWPIYLPWFALLFYWRRLNPAARIIHVLFPVAFITMEIYNVANRLDMTGKIWGNLYGAAWAVFIPTLAAARSWVLRGVLAVLLVTGGISTCFWVDYFQRTMITDDIGHLEATGNMRTDPFKARILDQLRTINHRVIMTGKSMWGYDETPLLAAFTHNWDYVAWAFHVDRHINPMTYGAAARREIEINRLYDGTLPDPLDYLRDRGIAALVIWPDDRISNDVLAKLKTQLAPAYWYEECRDIDGDPNDRNAGVFFARGVAGLAAPHGSTPAGAQ